MLLTDLITEPQELIPHQYNKIKSPQYDAVISKYLQTAPSVEHPVLIHMAGIPGSGKTTYYRTHDWPQHVFIAFDNIMEDLKEYQNDLKAFGAEIAFNKWEIPARIIGYELLRLAVEQHKNIFFDNGGSSQGHLELIKNIKKFGYTTAMYYIDCPLQVAIERSIIREKEINRHIPIETIEDRFYKTINKIKQYQQIVDCFYHIDYSSTLAEKIA